METVMTGSRRERLHRLWPTIAAGGALLFAFFGERVLHAHETAHYTCDVIAAAMILAATVMRAKELQGATPDKRPVAKLLLMTTLGVLVALAIYAVIPLALSAETAKKPAAIAWALWPTLLAISVFPLASIEVATMSVAFNERYEHAHVRHAFQRGLGLALLLGVLFFTNFLADRHEVKWDLSYGQKATASETTKRAIRDLTSDVEVTLFFPKANEVAESLRPYFDSLKSVSPHLKLKQLDLALASQAAKDAGVTENGVVAVTHEKAHDKIRLGDKFPAARSGMRRFDTNFLTSLLKVTKEKKIAYFTIGHEERSISPAATDIRPAMKILKQLLDQNQYTIKSLGVAEGLADKIPRDASVIFIMGAAKPFLPAEIEALKAALDHGTHLLIAIEGDPLTDLMAALGLKFDPTVLASERSFYPLTHTEADRTLIFTNRYSSHESVTTMTRNQARLATLFQKAGSLAKLDKLPERTKVDVVLTTMDDTFQDTNGNFKLDPNEKKMAYGLAAAVTRTSTSGKRGDEMRAFVIADADVFSDELIKNDGNVVLLADLIYWLRNVEEPVVPPVSAEDVQIVHKKDEDTLWFYSSVLGVPALVFAFGLVSVRRRRRS
jgi:gliding motility-associatede transport system auxiliary component